MNHIDKWLEIQSREIATFNIHMVGKLYLADFHISVTKNILEIMRKIMTFDVGMAGASESIAKAHKPNVPNHCVSIANDDSNIQSGLRPSTILEQAERFKALHFCRPFECLMLQRVKNVLKTCEEGAQFFLLLFSHLSVAWQNEREWNLKKVSLSDNGHENLIATQKRT